MLTSAHCTASPHQFIGAVVTSTSAVLGTKGVSDFGDFRVLRYAHRHSQAERP